jgi:hypothetical protein
MEEMGADAEHTVAAINEWGGGGKMFAVAASRAARARSGLSLGDDDAPDDFLPPSRKRFFLNNF